MKKIVLILIAILLVSFNGFANFSFNFIADYTITNSATSDYLQLIGGYYSDNFEAIIDFPVRKDGKYVFTDHSSFILNHYFLIQQGYLKVYFNKDFYLRVGQSQLKDTIDSKYALFINQNIYKTNIELSFENDNAFYRAFWVPLNEYSKYGYPDRGMNFKTFGIKFGNFKIGYEDSVIYTDRTVDIYYLFSPFPVPIIQAYKNSMIAPWGEYVNDNSIVGLFIEYDNQKYKYFLQVLADDLNMNRYFDPDSYQNPDKVAWSTGLNIRTNSGKFGIYNAGATKYTYERLPKPYEYTQYPASVYPGGIIDYKDNYIGYLYGEDSLSTLLEYENTFDKLWLKASGEYVISGSKSPHDPWHEESNYIPGTHFLEEKVKEYMYSFETQLKYQLTSNILLGTDYKYTKYINKIALVDDLYWKPQKGVNENINSFSIYFIINFQF
ncbi:hypothetical protein XO10_08515 [Marinitoga sp. 1135]|uniref:hypothetical protein n=1 Tax=Marinitoga sp. 1135 TaxID=1643333 RepID=UPI001586C6D0|nr:hypothetical protein [Marinitoga sp. 1135]NUU96298.1 hypothetical protein [Marinitoga sp. 1135]